MLRDIDIDAQNIVMGIIGGTLIAFASTLHLMLFGRLTGMSSIFNSLIKCDQNSGFRWKFGFACGLLAGTYGIFMIFGHTLTAGNISIQLFDKQEESQRGLSILGFVIGGFLVGFGTKLGNGCTSGHGVCGLPRFSPRSWIAVGMFLLFGIITATLRSYYPILSTNISVNKAFADQYKTIADFIFGLIIIYFIYDLNVSSASSREKMETIICAFIGFVFGLGLSLSGMIRRTRVLSFLSLTGIEIDEQHHTKGWNPTLAIVLLTAVGINMVTFNLILKQKPILAETFDIPQKQVDWKVFVGPAIFGIGWGLSGICPGPAMVNVFLILQMLAFIPFMAFGQVVADWIVAPKKITENKKTAEESKIQAPEKEKKE